jgi:hypothetical protein
MWSVNNKPFTQSINLQLPTYKTYATKKNLNTYMFTKHIQTYKHDRKIIKMNKEKRGKLNLKNLSLNLEFHVSSLSLAWEEGLGVVPNWSNQTTTMRENNNNAHQWRAKEQRQVKEVLRGICNHSELGEAMGHYDHHTYYVCVYHLPWHDNWVWATK